MNDHPDIELLLKYANGQLKPALAIAIGLHHQSCTQCQASVADIESIGGDNLESAPTAELSSSSFEVLMGQLDSIELDQSNLTDGNLSSRYAQLAVASSDLNWVKQLDEENFENTVWKKITNKISQSEILLGDETFKVELLKFKPKAIIPKHTHNGNEFTVVVQGSFKDCYGEYQRGSFIQMTQQNQHQPIAGENGCICLAITDKPLHFTGIFGPVINWLAK